LQSSACFRIKTFLGVSFDSNGNELPSHEFSQRENFTGLTDSFSSYIHFNIIDNK
jgi:hypothetical protein